MPGPMFPTGNNPEPLDSLEITMRKLLDAYVNGGSTPRQSLFPAGLAPNGNDSIEITAKKLLESVLLSL